MEVRRVVLATVFAASALAVACSGADRIGTPPSSIPPPTNVPPSPATCDATKVQFTFGSAPTDALLERARDAAQAGSARYLRYNEPITLEFLGSRVNLLLNQQGLIDGAYCG